MINSIHIAIHKRQPRSGVMFVNSHHQTITAPAGRHVIHTHGLLHVTATRLHNPTIAVLQTFCSYGAESNTKLTCSFLEP